MNSHPRPVRDVIKARAKTKRRNLRVVLDESLPQIRMGTQRRGHMIGAGMIMDISTSSKMSNRLYVPPYDNVDFDPKLAQNKADVWI